MLVLSHMCRNHKVRKLVEKQAKVVLRLKNANNDLSKRVIMIDAANSEYYCRPEVFAKTFRYIRKNLKDTDDLLDDKNSNNIGFSFHVGEDFIDIIDGLRAIDEAICFLNLKNGDRIGHALALGINPHDYYEKKSNVIMVKRQTHVDNMAWVLNKCRNYSIDLRGIKDVLVREFEKNYSYIYSEYEKNMIKELEYSNNIPIVSISDYYDSWKLRGDCPYIYLQNRNAVKPISNYNQLTLWDSASLNYYSDLKDDLIYIRQKKKLTELFLAYHFDAQVKIKGETIIEFKIFREYIEIIKDIQRNMQESLERKRISIECNPTSNYLIGNFKRFAEHPIVKFYNLGLTYDTEELKKSSQLHVSINTDDQGVFATDLENEYSMLAIALEKEIDEQGNRKYSQAMIYDWLDRIREMGWEQSFQNKMELFNQNFHSD